MDVLTLLDFVVFIQIWSLFQEFKIETGLLLSFVIVCGKLFDTESFFFEKCFGNSHTVGENVSLYDN